MIQANELRIGNWVKDKRDNKQYQFVRINPEFWDATFFEPIPLTPEVLEKCGFRNEENKYYRKKRICIFNNIKSVNIFIEDYDTDYEFICPNYLHQLQNLYFALTGEELNYTP